MKRLLISWKMAGSLLCFVHLAGKPKILRLYGGGYTVLPGDTEWSEFSAHFDHILSTRQIIVADIYRVQISCGFGVPYYEYTGERDHSHKWAEKKGEKGLDEYKKEKNMVSLDGLPTAMACKMTFI